MSNLDRSRQFLLEWILSNSVGVLASLPVGFAVLGILTFVAGIPGNLENVFNLIFVFSLDGIVIGLAQWFVLKKYISQISNWWMLTHAVGFPLSFYLFLFVGMSLSQYLFPLLGDAIALGLIATAAAAIGGATNGIPQWLLLRKWTRSKTSWVVWTVTSSLSCAFSAFISAIATVLLNAPDYPVNWVFIAFGSGGIYGGLTGLVLVWLLRSTPQN